jgi:hypothetical protein
MIETRGLPSVEEVRRAWHDATCPEGSECRDRSMHALALDYMVAPLQTFTLALFEAAVPRIKAEALREAAAELADTSQQEGFDHQMLRAYVERLDRRANRIVLDGGEMAEAGR